MLGAAMLSGRKIRWRRLLRGCALCTALCCCLSGSPEAQSVPQVDYHQHLRDPAYKTPGRYGTLTSAGLITLLDQVGLRRAVVLSTAYGPVPGPPEDEYERVKGENDWTAAQVRQFPDRLIAFCGVDPLKDYALAEIERCSSVPELRFGLKLHLGNSDVDLDKAGDLERLRSVMSAADAHRMAIAIHMHPSFSHHRPYGPKEARAFLESVLPAAPHVVVQLAHLAGPGGFDPQSDAALQVFIRAIEQHDPRMDRVFFDISAVAGVGDWRAHKRVIAQRIRQIGCQRILWGSDGAFGGGMTPAEALAAFRELPLTAAEFQQILSNRAPYLP